MTIHIKLGVLSFDLNLQPVRSGAGRAALSGGIYSGEVWTAVADLIGDHAWDVYEITWCDDYSYYPIHFAYAPEIAVAVIVEEDHVTAQKIINFRHLVATMGAVAVDHLIVDKDEPIDPSCDPSKTGFGYPAIVQNYQP